MVRTLPLAVGIFSSLATKCWADCLPTIPLVLDDIHDGDQKRIQRVEWDTFVIQPYPNTSEWHVDGKFDINCVALIDFNVTGNSDYPPVPLKMSMWVMQNIAIPSAVKLGFEFTDPTATLAPRTQPMNIWTSSALSSPLQVPAMIPQRNLGERNQKVQDSSCGIYTPHGQSEIFYDLAEWDEKAVAVNDDHNNETLTIVPYGNNETWTVETTLDDDCVAMVDFNVPNYPNPPPTSLVMSVWGMASISGEDKQAMVYTEPLASPIGSPENVWVPGNEEPAPPATSLPNTV